MCTLREGKEKGRKRMAIPALLFALPLVTAVILLVNRSPAIRNMVVRVSAVLIMALSVAAGFLYFGHPYKISIDSPLVRLVMMGVDGLAALTVLYYCARYRRYLTALLGILQSASSWPLSSTPAATPSPYGISASITWLSL